MSRIKLSVSVMLIILAAFVFALPVYAQDATPDVGAPTILEVATDTPPLVLSGDTTLTLDVTDETPAEPLLNNSTLVAIGALILAAVAVVKAVSSGGNVDQSITVQLELVQSNREAMAAYERQYAESSFTNREFMNMMAGVIRSIAPITPFKSDDALSGILEDIRTPDEPTAPSALSRPHTD